MADSIQTGRYKTHEKLKGRRVAGDRNVACEKISISTPYKTVA